MVNKCVKTCYYFQELKNPPKHWRFRGCNPNGEEFNQEKMACVEKKNQMSKIHLATDIKTGDIISSEEILKYYDAPCKVLDVKHSRNKVSLRLIPEFAPKDSVLIFTYLLPSDSLVIKRNP